MKRFCKEKANTKWHLTLFIFCTLALSGNGYGQTTPAHFTTVWQSENGQNHMNFLISSAILDDVQLGVNDEIAVFSGALCVGQARLTQPILVTDNTTFINLRASQNDGSNNGFNDNDTIVFKFRDSKNLREMQAKTVKYRTDMPTWITNGRFLAGTTAVVEIVSYTEYTQTIPFIKGTNLFSSYVIPLNTNLTAVMKALCNQGAVSKILDENGKSFQYSTTTKSWVNNIGSLTNTEGYSITTNMSCNLIITGKLVGLPLDIPLKTTSNFISYPRMDVVNAMTVIQPLITQNKLVKVQDEKGLTIEKIKGVWRNNIGNFTPGKAYKVTVSAACILTIQKSYPKSAVISSQTERMDYFVPVYEGNGLNHMNNNLVGLTGSGFQIGDELAAFDGAACVGSVKLNTDNFIRDFACLIASSASSPENPDGFVEGHSIQLFSWSKATGTKSSMQTEINSGEMSYKKLASVELQLKSTATSIASIENSIHFDVFPNPAKDIITIRFSQIPEPGRTIEIIDLSGKKIVSRVIHEISEEFDVRDQPAGLYVVKSILGKSEMVQKIMLN